MRRLVATVAARTLAASVRASSVAVASRAPQRHDSMHETLGVRARGIPRLAEEHHLLRGSEADEARQAVGREPRHDAVPHGRQPEGRLRRSRRGDRSRA